MKSNIEWKSWGDKDPMYGVAAWEGREKAGPNPWTEEEFYRLGELDWQDFRLRWQRYGLDFGNCVEIGCGAGRITAPLSQSFTRVDAVDISEAMIQFAQSNIDRNNIQFHLVDGSSIPRPDNSTDAVFSTHVFQHFDRAEDATRLFKEISRVLKVKGTMMIHVPLFSWPAGTPNFAKHLYNAKKQMELLKAGFKRQLIQRGRSMHLMRLNSYEARWVYSVLPFLGFVDIELLTFQTHSNGSAHSFVMARKGE